MPRTGRNIDLPKKDGHVPSKLHLSDMHSVNSAYPVPACIPVSSRYSPPSDPVVLRHFHCISHLRELKAELQPIPRIIPRKESLWVLHPLMTYNCVSISPNTHHPSSKERRKPKKKKLTTPHRPRLITLHRRPLASPLIMLPDPLLQLFQFLRVPHSETRMSIGISSLGREIDIRST